MLQTTTSRITHHVDNHALEMQHGTLPIRREARVDSGSISSEYIALDPSDKVVVLHHYLRQSVHEALTLTIQFHRAKGICRCVIPKSNARAFRSVRCPDT